jgi:integrase
MNSEYICHISNGLQLDLVFPSSIGTSLTASNIRRAFRKLHKALGLPKIRFHDLRHTAASLMLNHGIPVLILALPVQCYL